MADGSGPDGEVMQFTRHNGAIPDGEGDPVPQELLGSWKATWRDENTQRPRYMVFTDTEMTVTDQLANGQVGVNASTYKLIAEGLKILVISSELSARVFILTMPKRLLPQQFILRMGRHS